MSFNNQQSEPGNKPPVGINMSLINVGGQVGCAILLLIIVALAAGIGLDRLLDTKPVFTIGLFLGSFPVSLYLAYRLTMRSVKQANPNQPDQSVSPQAEEEEKR